MRVICECGCNWDNLKEAMLMIKKAKEAGAWAVKFQIFNKNQADAIGITHRLIINKEKAGALLNYAKKVEIPLFFSVMYPEAFDWLFDLNVPFYKIRLSDNQNCKLLLRVLMTNKPFFISYDRIIPNILGVKTDLALKLFCISKYPAKLNEYMRFFDMSNHFSGISDHTDNIYLLQRALSEINIRFFEKHVMLNDRCLESGWSITFEELKEVLK